MSKGLIFQKIAVVWCFEISIWININYNFVLWIVILGSFVRNHRTVAEKIVREDMDSNLHTLQSASLKKKIVGPRFFQIWICKKIIINLIV